MADTTSALPSQLEPVVDRYRRWSPIWYPWIKKILETLRTEAAARFAITETVDEISGKYTIDLTEDGIQRGAIKLDGSGTISEIGLLADRVVVYLPDDETGKPVFAVGNVAGAPAVVLAGNMYVDGFLQARHLSADTVSAYFASFGVMEAGRIQNAANTTFLDLDTGGFQFTAAS